MTPPEEVAARSRQAGMSSEQVRVLTELFRGAGVQVMDLPYSPELGGVTRGFTDATGIEWTPGEVWWVLRVMFRRPQ